MYALIFLMYGLFSFVSLTFGISFSIFASHFAVSCLSCASVFMESEQKIYLRTFALRDMKRWLFPLLAALIIVADRITKYLALQGSYVKNYGLLFGVADLPALRWVFVAAVSLILCFFLYTLARKDVQKKWFLQIGLFLMVAGLIGNLIDRIIYGYVIDFIRLSWFTTFNLSDVSIFIGALLVLIYLIKRS